MKRNRETANHLAAIARRSSHRAAGNNAVYVLVIRTGRGEKTGGLAACVYFFAHQVTSVHERFVRCP